ncbi:MAG: phosphate transport system protein [Pseudonocardiales bacterium]|jgi:phosphate transport system protein|nr:phosphate transport system protein [Pseudonocardiales bacterium]
MCGEVAVAVQKATRALLDCGLQLAEEVISEDVKADELRADAEAKAFALLALQAPEATDLRIVMATIHAAGDIERIGDLALHVAQAARRRHPHPVLPGEIKPDFTEMGRVGVALAVKAGEVIRGRDLATAELETDDDAMDALHRHMFTVLMDRNWTYRVAAAVDVTLLAPFYERYADHAVSVARRIIYVITGQMPGTGRRCGPCWKRWGDNPSSPPSPAGGGAPLCRAPTPASRSRRRPVVLCALQGLRHSAESAEM